MTFETNYKPGDKVIVVKANADTASSYTADHGIPINSVVTLKSHDRNDHTWLVHEANTSWVSEFAFESPVDDEEFQETLRSIMAAANPNIALPPPPREIFNPDHCPPYTLITVGHPDNGRVACKLPDIKHSAKNRWRDVNSGKLVDREDFRAGWDYYRTEVSA